MISSRRAHLDDARILHDGDVGADLQRLVEVVADEDDGLVRASAAARAARPAAWCGSAGRAPRTARPSAGCRRRWRRRGRGRRAAACRPTARGRTSRPTGRGRPGPASRGRCARARRLRMPRSSSPKPTFSATVRQGSSANCWNTMAIRGASAAGAGSRGVAAGDVDLPCRRPRPATRPRVTWFSRLTARSSVDLPEPDRPISTQISPFSIGERGAGHAQRPGRSPRGSPARRGPCSISGRARSGWSPNTMSTLLELDRGHGSVRLLRSRRAACTRGRARSPAARWRARPRSRGRC